jgi:D-aminopeptidase
VKERLRHHGHRYKAIKEAARLGVTGVVVRDRTLLMPNVQHKDRHQLREQIKTMPEGFEKAKMMASLIGRDGTEKQIAARNN